MVIEKKTKRNLVNYEELLERSTEKVVTLKQKRDFIKIVNDVNKNVGWGKKELEHGIHPYFILDQNRERIGSVEFSDYNGELNELFNHIKPYSISSNLSYIGTVRILPEHQCLNSLYIFIGVIASYMRSRDENAAVAILVPKLFQGLKEMGLAVQGGDPFIQPYGDSGDVKVIPAILRTDLNERKIDFLLKRLNKTFSYKSQEKGILQ